MARKPPAARDAVHVPPVDPRSYWGFVAGVTQVIAVEPYTAFRVDEVNVTWIKGAQFYEGKVNKGELDLNWPVVILRAATGEPMLTLTLRRVQGDCAWIQVTYNPLLGKAVRVE